MNYTDMTDSQLEQCIRCAVFLGEPAATEMTALLTAYLELRQRHLHFDKIVKMLDNTGVPQEHHEVDDAGDHITRPRTVPERLAVLIQQRQADNDAIAALRLAVHQSSATGARSELIAQVRQAVQRRDILANQLADAHQCLDTLGPGGGSGSRTVSDRIRSLHLALHNRNARDREDLAEIARIVHAQWPDHRPDALPAAVRELSRVLIETRTILEVERRQRMAGGPVGTSGEPQPPTTSAAPPPSHDAKYASALALKGETVDVNISGWNVTAKFDGERFGAPIACEMTPIYRVNRCILWDVLPEGVKFYGGGGHIIPWAHVEYLGKSSSSGEAGTAAIAQIAADLHDNTVLRRGADE